MITIFQCRITRAQQVVLFLSALLLLFLSPTAMHAQEAFEDDQEASLRESLDLYGGYVEQVAIGAQTAADDNLLLYAGVNAPNGIYSSNDFGDTWNGPTAGSDFGTVSDVAASSTPGTAFMIGGITLYRTQNGGATWQALEGEDYGQALATSETTIVAAKRDGTIAISTDDGDTFFNVTVSGNSAESISDIAIGSDSAVYVLQGAGDSNALYRVTDSGAEQILEPGNWRYVGSHPTIQGIAIVAGSDGVLQTTNGGNSWQPIDDANEVQNIGKVTIRPDSTIYVGRNYTVNGGATWADITDGATNESVIKGDFIAFDDVHNYQYTKSGRGVARATQGGATWEDAVSGILGVTVYDLSQSADKETVWIAAQGGFARSTNFASAIAAGATPTWDFPIYPDADENGNSSIDFGSVVWVDPEDKDHVIAVVTNRLWSSEDGGESWTEAQVSAQGSARKMLRDGDTGRLYLSFTQDEGSVSGSVWLSDDNGITWEDMGLPDAPAGPLAIDGDGMLLVGVGSEQDDSPEMRGVYLYDGAAWTHLSADSSHPLYQQMVNELAYSQETGLVYAAAGETNRGGFFVSDDAGAWAEWKAVEDFDEFFWGQGIALDPSGQFVYVSTARPSGTGTIYKCTAVDVSCKEFYVGLKDEAFNIMMYDGLLTGSNAGMYNYQSKAVLTLEKQNYKKGSAKRKAGKVQLVAVLTDSATGELLNDRAIKLYRKTKNSSYTFFKKEKQKNGAAMFVVRKQVKKRWYQARFVPKSEADLSTFVGTLFSEAVTVNAKK